MKTLIFLLFFTIQNQANDSLKVDSNAVEISNKVLLVDQVDSSSTAKEFDKKETWIEKNSGSLVGSIGGAFTAILAAFLTNYFSVQSRKKKDKKIYEGVLYSIHTELHWQLNHTGALRNQLNEIERISKLNEEFCVEKAPNSIDTRYLEYCRQRLLEYDDFDHKIVALLSTHINLLNDTNVNIDFRVAQKLKAPEGERLTKEMIGKYFSKIEEDNLQKIEISVPLIRTHIEKELEGFPEELFIESEFKKSKSNS